MKKLNMFYRVMVCFIVFSMLITSMPAVALGGAEGENAAASDAVSIVIHKDGAPVTAFTMSDTESVTLHAAAENVNNMGCRWQILDNTDSTRWIDISDAMSENLVVTYSLIGSMLNAKGQAVIRCTARSGETMYASEPVTITVSYSVPSEEPVIQSMMQPAVYGRMAKNTTGSGNDGYETVSIVINYIFDNGGIAFEPYGASVAKGSEFKATIDSPTVLGYKPVRRMGEEYVDAKSITLDYAKVEQDIVINVIYEPDLVEFSVHHHLQNLLDDDYSVSYDRITTSYALTGSIVPEGLALNLPGFTALAYERLYVAADGSTVVEIRYNRNYYLVDFDNNGGYNAEPVYTRFGASVGVNTPIRHGYVFGGWELISYNGNTPTAQQKVDYAISEGTTITVPDANLRYRAIWITQQTEYTIVFWKENADDNGYSYWGHLEGQAALSGSRVSGSDRIKEVAGIVDQAYFTYNSEKTDKNVLVEGDGSTIVNVYYNRKYYAITFKATGTCTIPAGHTHGDSCYDLICDRGHKHDASCVINLTCGKSEHTAHTEKCLICGKAEHIHGSGDCACQLAEHTHTKSCWKNVGTSVSKPYNAPNNPKDGQIYKRSSKYYIYIKGTWYNYSGKNVSNGDVVDASCGMSEHTHGTNCFCSQEAHTHTDSCYRDIIHSHNDLCYTYSCGEDEHTHSAACKRLKCGITERHSHSSNCNSSRQTNTVKVVYRKYEQSISDLWPVTDDNGKSYTDGQRWSPSDSSYYDQVLVYLSNMPADDFTLTLNTGSYEPYTMNYYLQVLDGQTYENTVTRNGKTYYLANSIKARYNYITKAEDFFDILGFVQSGSNPEFDRNNQISISGSNRVANFYYDRSLNELKFSSNGDVLTNKTVQNVPFDSPLKNYYFVPDYPSTLEPNAYAFGGWYTSPGCFPGTEVNWDTITMTAGDLLLYAKWEPIRHKVQVYLDANKTTQIGQTQEVAHNGFAKTPEGEISNGNYIFQGWFYMDGNEEKAFTFTGIPVKQDLQIYAKWSSHVSVNYTIHYKLHGTDTQIADSTTGTSIAGQNKTFDAKAGTSLYAAYQIGYYPLTNSHTITMSVDGTHEFTFYYVYVESMPYIVRYVDASTNAVIQQKKVMDNNLSVVTETFMKVAGKMPDAYQKRLVLSASGVDADQDGVLDQNVITFYYSSDSVHAYYQVVHYIENIAGDGYREYRSEEAVGEIGKSYTVSALTLTGFTFDPARTRINSASVPGTGTSVTAQLGADGILIELYYVRNNVTYTVKYTDAVTGESLIPDKVASGLYGAQVLEYAVDLSARGYRLAGSEDLKILSLSTNESMNVIEFKYSESVGSIQYVVVGPDGCGTLSQSSENVMVITGRPNGSIPTAADGFLFVGWYLDLDCTMPVSAGMVDSATGRLTPTKAANEIWSNMTYYAKFIAKETDMTICVSGISDVDAQQAVLFRVQGIAGTETEGVDLTVAVIGNSSVTISGLPIGSYIITELTDWSWRYNTAEAQRTVTVSSNAAENVFGYNQYRLNGKWLDGNHGILNLFQFLNVFQ